MKEKTTKTQNSHLDNNEESSDKTEAYFTIHPMVLRIDTIQSFDVFKKNSDSNYELFHPASKAYTSTVHGSIFKNSISRLYVKESYKSDPVKDDYIAGTKYKFDGKTYVITKMTNLMIMFYDEEDQRINPKILKETKLVFGTKYKPVKK